MLTLKKSNIAIDGYSSFVSNLLGNRNITTKMEADKFFNDTIENLNDYWLINNIKEAVDLTMSHIKRKSRIKIIGDYDADGCTGTGVLTIGLKDCGANVSYRIPCRIKEGYGINTKIIEEIITQGCDLIITVDNGIKGNEAIQKARDNNIDVIILDHHELGKVLPNANVIVDLHTEEEKYPFKDLAGVGVAYMFICALYEKYNFPKEESYKLLDLVAIGTIADVVPLKEDNRILVKEGLKRMSSPLYNRLGVKRLLQNNFITENITSYDIGYKIGPCINAPGRILENGANLTMNLLLSNNIKVLEKADYIVELNKERKELTKIGLNQALSYIKENHLEKDKFIVVYLENLPDGIIGLISGQLTEKFYKPSLVFTKTENGLIKASGRCIDNIDLLEIVSMYDNLYEKYGGHEQACGITMQESKLEELRDVLNVYIEDNYQDSIFEREEYYEDELSEEQINMSLVEDLEKFEPCGSANPVPRFYTKKFKLVNTPLNSGKEAPYITMGKEGEHVKLFGKNSYALGFSKSKEFKDLNCPNELSLKYYLSISTFSGQKAINLTIDKMFLPKETVISRSKSLSVKDKINQLSANL